MPYNATADLWYQNFQKNGLQASILLCVYGVRVLLATMGIMFNVALVYVTFKNKSLHGVCNILIAMECVFVTFMDLSYLVSFFIVLSGIRFIQYSVCFPILLPLSTAGQCAQMNMLLTGIDRLLAVLFPVWYKKRESRFYMAFCCIVLLGYGIYFDVLYLISFPAIWDIMVTCSTEEMGAGDFGPLMTITGLVMSGSIMGVYTLVWFMVFKMKSTSKNVDAVSKKLVKALVFMITFNLFGVFLRLSIKLTFSYVPVGVFVTKWNILIGSFVIILVYNMNAPVLYVISKEYRNIFNQHFTWLKTMFKYNESNTQTTITVAVASSTIVNHQLSHNNSRRF